MLIFLVQTLWLFIDELTGKGLDIITILKFLVYYAPKLIPLVMPLSVLLASLMTFGTFAENYEFAAMKSTGISLQRAMRSLIIFHVLLGMGTFQFSNHVIPYGEVKYYNLRKNLAKLKPALAIREGMFNEIGEMNIKVKQKYGDDDRLLEDVIIHEKTPDNQNNIVIKAKRGELKSKTTEANLQLVLYDGNRYEKVHAKNFEERRRFPHSRVFFEEYVMNIDLSQFNNVDLDEEQYNTFRMLKVNQLRDSIPKTQKYINHREIAFAENFSKKGFVAKINNTHVDIAKDSLPKRALDFMNPTESWKYQQAIRTAIDKTNASIRNLENKKRDFFRLYKYRNLQIITLQDKYTLIFVCILLFFIGASLGAIIRKGGLGLPLVLSVVIFLTYHYIGVFVRNSAEDNTLDPIVACWIATFLLAPAALLLTRRASADRGAIDLNPFIKAFTNLSLKKLRSKKKTNAAEKEKPIQER